MHDSTSTNLAQVEPAYVLPDHNVSLIKQGAQPGHQVTVISDFLGAAVVLVEYLLVTVPLSSSADDGPVLGNLRDADVLIPGAPQAVCTNADKLNVEGQDFRFTCH